MSSFASIHVVGLGGTGTNIIQALIESDRFFKLLTDGRLQHRLPLGRRRRRRHREPRELLQGHPGEARGQGSLGRPPLGEGPQHEVQHPGVALRVHGQVQHLPHEGGHRRDQLQALGAVFDDHPSSRRGRREDEGPEQGGLRPQLLPLQRAEQRHLGLQGQGPDLKVPADSRPRLRAGRRDGQRDGLRLCEAPPRQAGLVRAHHGARDTSQRRRRPAWREGLPRTTR